MDYEEVVHPEKGYTDHCDRVFDSYYYDLLDTYRAKEKGWYYAKATGNGTSDVYKSSSEVRCNCSVKHGYSGFPESNGYGAPCSMSFTLDFQQWTKTVECPKGWGYNKQTVGTGGIQCIFGSRYDAAWTEQKPIYGYVTRYRDAWYPYYSGRISHN